RVHVSFQRPATEEAEPYGSKDHGDDDEDDKEDPQGVLAAADEYHGEETHDVRDVVSQSHASQIVHGSEHRGGDTFEKRQPGQKKQCKADSANNFCDGSGVVRSKQQVFRIIGVGDTKVGVDDSTVDIQQLFIGSMSKRWIELAVRSNTPGDDIGDVGQYPASAIAHDGQNKTCSSRQSRRKSAADNQTANDNAGEQEGDPG